jgi:2-polyprenyl-3-methyl-5-hydroxy-6-metoxy-1,4-benzoquinol methylase
MKKHCRKHDEEHELPRERYFGNSYFERPQLHSLSEQIHIAHKYGNSPFLEIGLGNGFVSGYLTKAGENVTMMDVNSNLKPDILGSILEEPKHFKPKSFETVLCFEVLEHLPWDDFSKAIDTIASLCSGRAIISLPRVHVPVERCEMKLF